MRRWAACLLLGGAFLRPELAAAQSLSPMMGFAWLPSFAFATMPAFDGERWTGSYAVMSTGYEVVSSKRFGSYSGPTIGFEGGRMWQEGRMFYGIVGGFDALIDGRPTPRLGSFAYSRDLAGALQVQVGTLLTPDVLVYGKAGALVVHDRLSFRSSAPAPIVSRDNLAIVPDARVGVEWAVTDQLTLGVEAGVTGGALRRY